MSDLFKSQEFRFIENHLDIINALADKTRQEILLIFYSQKEANANDIAARFELSRPTISHHLNLMRRLNILNARKEGKQIYYSFNKPLVTGVLETLLSFFKNCC